MVIEVIDIFEHMQSGAHAQQSFSCVLFVVDWLVICSEQLSSSEQGATPVKTIQTSNM